MKIQILIKSTRFTGGRKELFRHANELVRRGHDVTVWSCRQAHIEWMDVRAAMQSLEGTGLEQLPRGDICLFERPRFAQPLLRADRGIAVHFCQGFEGTDVDNRVAAVKNRGVLRGLRQLWHLWQRRRLIYDGYRAPTVKIVVHPYLRDLLQQRFQQTAHLVPNSLPAGVFTPPDHRNFSGRTILVVGPTDTPCKRISDALHAVALLKRQRPDIRLVRVAQHEMRELERARGVTDEYHIMLPPPAMAQLYRRADVLIMPSDSTEGFGLPALEAMACGTPVVLTDIPAFRLLAHPADYAHFVPVGQPEQLARSLDRLLDNADERRRLSRRGLAVAREYSPQRSFDAMERALYERSQSRKRLGA